MVACLDKIFWVYNLGKVDFFSLEIFFINIASIKYISAANIS